tara:strand:+ start:781 stop:1041 length:261 start_codon:yes stop_codon:yes gene_type:complete
MPKKKKEEPVEETQQEFVQQILMQESPSNGDREFRMGVLAMAKEILERNAALQWEQDKTRGLSVSADEIIEEAHKLLAFVDAEDRR